MEYKILGKTNNNTLFKNIDNLSILLPKNKYNQEIIKELHKVRIIGNAYTHNSEKVRDVSKDKKTCYLALKKTSLWLVDFNKNYHKVVFRKKLCSIIFIVILILLLVIKVIL